MDPYRDNILGRCEDRLNIQRSKIIDNEKRISSLEERFLFSVPVWLYAMHGLTLLLAGLGAGGGLAYILVRLGVLLP